MGSQLENKGAENVKMLVPAVFKKQWGTGRLGTVGTRQACHA